MAFYTGKGDDGTTKLFNTPSGVRISKNSPVAEALGTMDELNSFLGLCKTEARIWNYSLQVGKKTHFLHEIVHEVQNDLFTIQAELAGSDKKIKKGKISAMEKTIETIEKLLSPITSFSISGATELSARFDVARTLARRAERRVIFTHETKERVLSKNARTYMNRLSSLLFALARYSTHCFGKTENSPTYN